MIIAGVAFIIILKRRRRQNNVSQETPELSNGPVEAGYVGPFEAPGTMPEMTAELGHKAKAELAGFAPNVVIDKGDVEPQELYAPVERHVDQNRLEEAKRDEPGLSLSHENDS